MSDDIKQDFEAALVKHMLFKSKLRSFLFGSSTNQAPIRDPHACSFGRWIAERALTTYGHLPESRELDRLHVQIHQTANRLMDLHQQGHSDEAISGLVEVNAIADQITRLMRTMEAKLRSTP